MFNLAFHAAVTVLIMHSLCSRHYITSKDRVCIRKSPWFHMKATSQDGAAMQLMGITWSAFDHLLASFQPILEQVWRSRLSGSLNVRWSGRKRILQPRDVLGVTLAWIHVPSFHIMLMLVFAVTPTTLSKNLQDGRAVLLKTFKYIHAAHI